MGLVTIADSYMLSPTGNGNGTCDYSCQLHAVSYPRESYSVALVCIATTYPEIEFEFLAAAHTPLFDSIF